jgi:hypothetical protein
MDLPENLHTYVFWGAEQCLNDPHSANSTPWSCFGSKCGVRLVCSTYILDMREMLPVRALLFFAHSFLIHISLSIARGDPKQGQGVGLRLWGPFKHCSAPQDTYISMQIFRQIQSEGDFLYTQAFLLIVRNWLLQQQPASLIIISKSGRGWLKVITAHRTYATHVHTYTWARVVKGNFHLPFWENEGERKGVGVACCRLQHVCVCSVPYFTSAFSRHPLYITYTHTYIHMYVVLYIVGTTYVCRCVCG